MDFRQPLQLTPQYRDYPWGGYRLRPEQLTAEVWAIYEENRIVAGDGAEMSLAQAAAAAPEALIGKKALTRTGTRFPLLIKLLDTAEWLSIQVHPDDAWAKRLAGPGQFGKTEAWHILEATPAGQVIAGMRPGVSAGQLADAIGTKRLLELVHYQDVQAGDTIFMPARTLHALGPGLLLYEVQQTSDITYRAYDWERPQTGGRTLHIEQARQVADPAGAAPIHPLAGSPRQTLATSQYFKLEYIRLTRRPQAFDTGGETFHALTVIEGEAIINCADCVLHLQALQSALIPAAAGEYELRSLQGGRLLVASL